MQEFVDVKDTFDYKHKNYTTTKNSTQRFDQAVQNLQRKLNEKGYTDKFGEPLKEDGIMGAKTLHAYDQMLEAETTKNAKSQPTTQVTQLDASTPTQIAETNNLTREGMEKYRNVEFASRGGNTRRKLNYLQNNPNLANTKTDFSNVNINYNNVTSVAENIVSEKNSKG